MNLGESFKKLLSPGPEASVPKVYDSIDYEPLFCNFENKFIASNKESTNELEILLSNFESTFSETEMGKDHYHLTKDADLLKSTENPPGEVGADLGKINSIQKEIEEIENSDEFKRYQSLKNKIQESINSIEENPQKVA